MKRIDQLITPPGLIARARCYSLVLTNDALYIINTGKAANPTMLFSELSRYNRVAVAMQQSYMPEIEACEKRMDAGELDTLVDGKNSRRFMRSEVEMKVDDGKFCMFLTAAGKKYKFLFQRQRLPEVREFAA